MYFSWSSCTSVVYQGCKCNWSHIFWIFPEPWTLLLSFHQFPRYPLRYRSTYPHNTWWFSPPSVQKSSSLLWTHALTSNFPMIYWPFSLVPRRCCTSPAWCTANVPGNLEGWHMPKRRSRSSLEWMITVRVDERFSGWWSFRSWVGRWSSQEKVRTRIWSGRTRWWLLGSSIIVHCFRSHEELA